jgi:CBS domain-containing protein
VLSKAFKLLVTSLFGPPELASILPGNQSYPQKNEPPEKEHLMRKNDPINHIMSTNIESIQVGQKLSEVHHLMANMGIHHVPIVDGKKLVGLVSFVDIMKLSLVLQGASEQTIGAIIDQQYTIRDVMITELVTIGDGDTVRIAAETLSGGDFHSLPVIEANGDLAGIVTSTDLIRYLSDQY